MTVENKTNRLVYVDSIKGVLLVLMVFGHMLVCDTVPRLTVYRLLYVFHMPAFVLISGYFYKSKRKLFTRVKELYLPYIVTCGFMLFATFLNDSKLVSSRAIAILYGTCHRKDLWFIDIADHSHIGPIWYLILCIGLILSYCLFDKVKSRLKGKTSIVFVIIVGIILPIVAGHLLSTYTRWAPFSLYSVLFAFPFYTIGACVREYNLNRDGHRFSVFIYVVVMAIALLLYSIVMLNLHTDLSDAVWQSYYDMGCGLYMIPFFDEFIGVIVCFCLFGIAYKLRNTRLINNEVMSYLGQNSLSVLCLHTIDIMSFRVTGLGWFVQSILYNIVDSSYYMIIYILLSVERIFIYYFVIKALSKFKTFRYIFSIKDS